MKILVTEDEEDLSEVIAAFLEHEGYDVDVAFNGREALDKLKTTHYDALVMDIMMPVMDGIEALSLMRKNNDHTPVLLLTAKTEVDDRVTGLDAGADDYLTKPFAMKELTARIRSLTRRKEDYDTRIISVSNIQLDVMEGTLTGRNSISLGSKETKLLEFFMQNPNEYIEEKVILEKVWDDEADAGKETVSMYISFLRSKLSAVGADITIISESEGEVDMHSLTVA